MGYVFVNQDILLKEFNVSVKGLIKELIVNSVHISLILNGKMDYANVLMDTLMF